MKVLRRNKPLHLAYLLSHVRNRGGNMESNYVATLGAKKRRWRVRSSTGSGY